jgi:hypothetical protein
LKYGAEKAMPMKRPDFLKLGTGLPAAVCVAGAIPGDDPPRAISLSEIDSFNYVLGTQSIGATYQFTRESVLVETARAILDLGSNILKFTMGRDYQRMMPRPSKTAYPGRRCSACSTRGAMRRAHRGSNVRGRPWSRRTATVELKPAPRNGDTLTVPTPHATGVAGGPGGREKFGVRR